MFKFFCKEDESKIFGKSPNREIKRKERLITKIMMPNYQQKLSGDVMTYYIISRKNVGIIGILEYPKIHLHNINIYM